MDYQILGRTGLRVSPLCFGTMSFGGEADIKLDPNWVLSGTVAYNEASPRASTNTTKTTVIELGGNDGLRAIPPEEIRRNLENLVELARETGASALITGIMIPPNYGSEYITAFRRAFQQAADSTGVPLTPFVLEEIALKPGMMQEDGIHPTAEAQPLIVDNLWPWIEPMLRSSADRP